MPDAAVADAAPAIAATTSSPEVLKSFDDIISRTFPPDPPAGGDAGDAGDAGTGDAGDAGAAPAAPAVPAKTTVTPPVTAAEPSLDPFLPPDSVLELIKPLADPGAAPVSGKDAAPDDMTLEIPEEAPEGTSEAGKVSWKASRELIGRLRTQVKSFQENVGKGDPEVLAQNKNLEQKNLELTQRLEAYDAEQIPWYQQNIGKPLKDAQAGADKLAEMAKMDPVALRKAMALDGIARIEALDEIYEGIESPTLKSKLERQIAEVDALQGKREDWLTDRKSNVEQRTLEERVARSNAIAAEQQKILGLTHQIVEYLGQKQGFEMFVKSPRAEDKAWNDRIDGDMKQIEFLATENNNKQVVLSALALAVACPHYKKYANSTAQKLAAANKKIAELEGAIPGLDGRNGAVPRGEKDGEFIADGEDFAAGAIRLLNRQRAG